MQESFTRPTPKNRSIIILRLDADALRALSLQASSDHVVQILHHAAEIFVLVEDLGDVIVNLEGEGGAVCERPLTLLLMIESFLGSLPVIQNAQKKKRARTRSMIGKRASAAAGIAAVGGWGAAATGALARCKGRDTAAGFGAACAASAAAL